MTDPAVFHARLLAAADADGRLPLPAVSGWADIFPFEHAGLLVTPIQPLSLPEPPRHGEDPSTCRCAGPTFLDGVVWGDERWVLRGETDSGVPAAMYLQPREHLDLEQLDDAMAAELGVLTVRISRVLAGLEGIGRVHVNKWGDGGAHLHLAFFARPAGVLQLRGSCLPDWEELLPRVPLAELMAAYRQVAEELAEWHGEAYA